ncbi:MAG: adenylate/guanylate cyclase domain-containing protein, partial [Candidatus Electryoneaceae bacterium]|nr:adenylate/guanylate cyclase domain-containing protein [Candidatus Electryoneaceae bacterium]
LFQTEHFTVPGLPLQMASLITDGNLEIPDLDSNGRLWLRFYGRGGPEGAFPYVSAAALIAGLVPPESLEGKILIIGGYAAGLMDYKSTPVAEIDYPYPGFEVHATLLSNILQNDGLTPFSRNLEFFFTIIFGIVGLVAFKFSSKMLHHFLGLLLISVIGIGILLWLFHFGKLFPLVTPLLGCYLGVGTQMYTYFFLEGKKKKELEKSLTRHLNPLLIKELMNRPDALEIGEKMVGEERRVTILFTDIVGFVNLCRGKKPKEIIEILNAYHEVTVEVIFKKRGMLDKYIGDSVMAVFGVFDDQSLSIRRTQNLAAETILGIQEETERLTRRRKDTIPKLGVADVRIGAHSADVIIGSIIGHSERKDFTVVGSGVNLANRLEGATREFRSKNLVSEEFCLELDDSIKRRKLGRFIPKGFYEPITVYELLRSESELVWLPNWEKAWTLWSGGEREGAISLWEDIRATYLRDDDALRFLISRMSPLVTKSGENDDVWEPGKKI